MPTSSPSAAITASLSSFVRGRPCSAAVPAAPSAAGAAGPPGSGQSSPRCCTSNTNPRLSEQAVELAARGCCRAGWPAGSGCRRSPRTVYGGVSGRLLTWIADADVADRASGGEPLAVDRDRLGAGVPQPVDQQREVLVADQPGSRRRPGASSTVIRTPGPGDGAEAGADLEPRAAAPSASPCSVLVPWRAGRCRPTLRRAQPLDPRPAGRRPSSLRRSICVDQARPARRRRRRRCARSARRRRVDQEPEDRDHDGRRTRCGRPRGRRRVAARRAALRRRAGSPRRATAG